MPRPTIEYPVLADAQIDPIIAALGTLKIDRLTLTEVAAKRKEASRLAEEVGFDN